MSTPPTTTSKEPTTPTTATFEAPVLASCLLGTFGTGVYVFVAVTATTASFWLMVTLPLSESSDVTV